MDEVTTLHLPNGIRVLHRPVGHTRLLHCGVILDVGSRDELGAGELGMAHFIEHMLFKGTRKRKAFHILNRIDSVGGELNAFTTKEKTTYHASVAAEHTARAFELLADITFGSTFPQHEIEKEKTVIAEEIDMYEDDPEEAIFESFDAQVFPDHALGHPILGTKEVIAHFDTRRLLDFFAGQYGTNRIIVSVVGNAGIKQIERLAHKYFGGIAGQERPYTRTAPTTPALLQHSEQRPIQQTHFILGGRAVPMRHPHYMATLLLTNYLGGPSMNSRLNMNIRERYGLAYNIQTFYQPFVGSGIWGVYAAADPIAVGRVQQLVLKELALLRGSKLSTLALARIKKQFTGSLVLNYEGHFAQMLAQGKDLLDYGRLFSLEDAIKEVEALTAATLLEVAATLFDPATLSRLSFEPAKD